MKSGTLVFLYGIVFHIMIISCACNKSKSPCNTLVDDIKSLQIDEYGDIPKELVEPEGQAKIDSLEKTLRIFDQRKISQKNATPPLCDTFKVKILHTLARLYLLNNHDKTLEYANAMLELSENLDYQTGIADAYDQIGFVNDNKGNYWKALEAYQKALVIRQEMGNDLKVAMSYNNIGDSYRISGDLTTALDMQLKSLQIMERINDKKGVASCYNNLSLIYQERKNIDVALEYALKCLKLREELGSQQHLAISRLNIGNILTDKALSFYYKGDTLNFRKKLGEATANYSTAKEIFKQIQFKKGLAQAIMNLGNMYYYQDKFTKAIELHKEALKIQEQMGFKADIARSYLNIGGDYSNMPDSMTKALLYQKNALSLAEIIGDKEVIRTAHQNISYIGVLTNDFRLAYSHFILYDTLKNSIFSERNARKIERIENKYQYEKQKLEDERKQKSQAFYEKVAIVCIAVFISIYALIFYRYKNKLLVNPKLGKVLALALIVMVIAFVELLIGWITPSEFQNSIPILFLTIIITALILDSFQKRLYKFLESRYIKP